MSRSNGSKQLELGEIQAAMDVPYDKDLVELIARLLEQTTSLDVVRSFLKSKGEHFSAGSWDEMFEMRVVPALKKGAVTTGELIALLAQAEEFGGTQSFLYKCPAAAARNLMAEPTVRAAVKKMGIPNILENSRVLDQPEEPTISAVRWDSDKRGKCLVAKVVQRRFRLEPAGVDSSDNQLIKRWNRVPVRTVNVMRLYTSGLLELRVQAHSNNSNYGHDTSSLWAILADLFPPASFDQLSLAKAKDELYTRKDEMKGVIRFSDSTLRDDDGAVITAGTAKEQTSLFSNKGAAESIGAFMKHGGHCDEFNVWWLAQKSGVPSKPIHMLISGQPNEFFVTSACTKEDFEYVFDKLYALV